MTHTACLLYNIKTHTHTHARTHKHTHTHTHIVIAWEFKKDRLQG